jgi:hypothetical protein
MFERKMLTQWRVEKPAGRAMKMERKASSYGFSFHAELQLSGSDLPDMIRRRRRDRIRPHTAR